MQWLLAYTYLNKIKSVIVKRAKERELMLETESERNMLSMAIMAPLFHFFLLRIHFFILKTRKNARRENVARATVYGIAVCMSDSGNFCTAHRCSRFVVCLCACMQSINQYLQLL